MDEGLVGRDGALAAADRAVAAAGREPRVLAVLGEAGIGKSALLWALAERAEEAGLLVLEGRAAEHERELPFGLAVDALDDHVSTLHPRRLESLGAEREAELAAVLPAVAQHVDSVAAAGPGERFRYHRALRALLEMLARERPLALLLDDVHWADDASLELILHLIRRPPRSPHLLVLAARPVDPAPRLLDALRGVRSAELLSLEPLDAESAGTLLAGVPDMARRTRLVEEAGGNPLFLMELARVAGEPDAPLPPTLIAAVQQEVASLPPASRALLDGAAVAGDPFDPELAAQAAGLEEDALVPLDRLVAADVIRPTGTARGFRFRHPLVRRAVYDAAPPGWRLSAHERVAGALGARGASAAARAFHVEQAARPGDDEAIGLLVQAASEAADASPATAAHWYRAALRLLPADDSMRRAELLAPMAFSLGSAGRLPEARDAFVEVVGLLEPEAPMRPLLVATCAFTENVLGLHTDARRRLEAELARYAEHDQRALPLQTAHAVTVAFPQDVVAMRDSAARVLATVGEPEPGAPVRAAAVLARGTGAAAALWSADAEGAHAAADSGLAEYDGLADAAIAEWPNCAWGLGYALMLLERLEDCIAVTGRGIAVARAAHLGHILSPLSALQAMTLTNVLRLEEADAFAELAEETARLGGLTYQLQWTLGLRAVLATLRGEPDERRRLTAECLPLYDGLSRDDLFRHTGLCNLAALGAEEDPERSIGEMVRAAGPELERLDPTWSTAQLLVLVRASLALGRVEDAERWATVIEGRAATHGLAVGAARGNVARAELALARDDAETAVELTRHAAGVQERWGWLIDALPTRILHGRALAAVGRAQEAEIELRSMAEEAERRTAWRFRDAAAAQLRGLGVRLATGATTRRRAADRGELTEREREIAGLVAAGRSNKQVAGIVFLSEKTIEHHLSRVYAKLGVRSRTELAAIWE